MGTSINSKIESQSLNYTTKVIVIASLYIYEVITKGIVCLSAVVIFTLFLASCTELPISSRYYIGFWNQSLKIDRMY